MKKVGIIVGVSNTGVIGDKGTIPWKYSEDLKFFKRITTGNTVIMGRKTWESLGKALPDRQNIVVTRNKDYKAKGALVVDSLDKAIDKSTGQHTFIIGGSELYKYALNTNYCSFAIVTYIDIDVEGDTKLEGFNEDDWYPVKSESLSDIALATTFVKAK